MTSKIIWIIIAMLIVGVGGFYYYSKSGEAKNTTEVGSSGPVPNSGANEIATSEETASVKEFTVVGKSFSFAPNTISVNKGDRVRIVFQNAEGFHDLKIDELGVDTGKINGGESKAVEFTADKAGSFEYYCSVGKHRALGMKGTLIVQ